MTTWLRKCVSLALMVASLALGATSLAQGQRRVQRADYDRRASMNLRAAPNQVQIEALAALREDLDGSLLESVDSSSGSLRRRVLRSFGSNPRLPLSAAQGRGSLQRPASRQRQQRWLHSQRQQQLCARVEGEAEKQSGRHPSGGCVHGRRESPWHTSPKSVAARRASSRRRSFDGADRARARLGAGRSRRHAGLAIPALHAGRTTRL